MNFQFCKHFPGKIIPFVPGIPGPNSLSANAPLSPIIPTMPIEKSPNRIFNPIQNSTNPFTGYISLGTTPFRSMNLSISSAVVNPSSFVRLSKSPEPLSRVSTIKTHSSSEINNISSTITNHPHNLSALNAAWPSTATRDGNRTVNEKPFNFMRIADNLSPPKIRIDGINKMHGNLEVSATTLDKLKPRQQMLAHAADVSPLHINVECTVSDSYESNIRNTVAATIATASSAVDITDEKIKVLPVMVDSDNSGLVVVNRATKFLRPSSLPLKPGTFTPKKHHGITPTANTLPLISPETPRPSKHCVQLYLNGHAYTYLGLKCSTKPFYCTVNRPQPVYAVFAGRPELSMYSNWQTCAENNPNPLGFSPKEMMSLYDSRQRTHSNYQGCKYTTSNKMQMICTPSDRTQDTFKSNDSKENNRKNIEENQYYSSSDSYDKVNVSDESSSAKESGLQNLSTIPGGYKSNEDYTYVRGRGRGRYVCKLCGMRCIKPCTLKKHIRTVHSDVRPYTCRHCMFR